MSSRVPSAESASAIGERCGSSRGEAVGVGLGSVVGGGVSPARVSAHNPNETLMLIAQIITSTGDSGTVDHVHDKSRPTGTKTVDQSWVGLQAVGECGSIG